MSGHSKWSQIKHKKGATDQKKAAVFSKLLNAIAVAARENPNPDFNPRLRSTIEKARAANVPGENIERAINKSGETKQLEEVIIEAYGPEGCALIIEGITDNTNRTIQQVRQILADHGAKMAEQGSVRWAFEHTGGAWRAKFPQSVSSDAQKDLAALVSDLEEHADVQRIITNAATNDR